MSVHLEPFRALEREPDPAAVGARTDDEVELELPRIAVEDHVHARIDVAVGDLAVGGYTAPGG